jgi:biopolymer transport protein ExbD
MLKSMMRNENSKELMCEINVTPLVDICLVLVIIFMVTTAMFLQPPFQVILPKANAEDKSADGNIFVAIGQDGSLAVNESRTPAEGFVETINTKLRFSRTKSIVIRADEKTPSGTVIDIMNTIKLAGARRITFGTEAAKE